MKAKFYLGGHKVKIYTLEYDKGNEVLGFLTDYKHPEQRSVISFIVKILNRIADSGFESVHSGWFDSWQEGCEIICEIRKKRYRISCFKYEKDTKLLLTTTFIKKQMKEKKEYKRAIKLKKEFDKYLEWRD